MPHDSAHPADRAPLVAAGVAVALSIAVFVRPYFFVPDDGFFYPQVAHNAASLGWSTFNGVTGTNGYQPLWMLVNVAAAVAVRGARGPLLHAVLAIETGVLAATAFAFVRTLRARGFDGVVGAGVALLLLAANSWSTEAHLAALLAWLAVSEERRVLQGALLGLAVLARLDGVFMVPLLAGAIFVTERRARPAIVVAATASAIVAPYLAYNAIAYGHLVPISGAIKSSFPHLGVHLSGLGGLQRAAAVVALVGLALSRLDAARPVRVALWVLGGQTIAQTLYVVFFTDHPGTVEAWYAAVGCVNAALVAEVAWSWMARGAARRRRSIAIGALCVVLAAARGALKAAGINVNPLGRQLVVRVPEPVDATWDERIARWMSANLPAGSRIVVADFPGVLAYRTSVGVVALDGLTNDFRYDRDLVDRGVAAFLADNHVDYYLGPIPADTTPLESAWMTVTADERGTTTVKTWGPWSRRPGGSFVVTKSDLLLDMDDLVPRDEARMHVGIYRVRR